MGINTTQLNHTDNTFVHLHVHSEYSILDGAIRIEDLIAKISKSGHKSIALTDHANLHGAIDFYQCAKKAGINPIIGSEIYIEPTLGTQKFLQEATDLDETPAFHLVLLAQSYLGYQNLVRIVSSGYLNGHHRDVPVVSLQDIAKNSKDIIALSGCLKGELATLCSHLKSAENIAEQLQADPLLRESFEHYFRFMVETFGKSHFFAELINNGLSQQTDTIPKIVAVAKYYETSLVATCDAHYLDQGDREAHSVLTSIKNELTQSKTRNQLTNTNFHLLDNQEFYQLYQQWPEAIQNTHHIANMCQIEIEFGNYFLPQFELDGVANESTALEKLAFQGLEERMKQNEHYNNVPFSPDKRLIYEKRLRFELDTIIDMGFPGYFLIVQDFINWAKNQRIPVGPGRGSGAGSLVAYALRITDLDPIALNLIFERFLNPERISMPDFDVDFCQDRRDEVIKYVTDKYGNANVAQITTFGKMKAKAAIRDVGRVLEIGYSRVDRIAKLIPNELDIKLQTAIEKEPQLKIEAQQDDRIESLIRLALKIEGINRHTSVHAAGIVISQGGMENYVPVHTGEDGNLITQYEMKNAEKVGLVKFDFLGLKTLTVIDKAVQLINQRYQNNFAIESINLEEKSVYDLISKAHSVGIFQLESTGMQALLTKLKPSHFEDIIAVVALFRPGPLGSGMVDDFIERKHGRQKISYLHPSLESILRETYGIILYQEQVQKIAAELANYSLGEADLLRRAMGKKKPEEMAKQKTRFIEGCTENKIDKKIAEELFELMAMFAAYGFNKSHSAAYGLISYQTAYLKTFYPEEFMAAIMTCDMDNTEKLNRYIEECRRMNIAILPPDINRSVVFFDVPEANKIGFSLNAIKGIGSSSVSTIISAREKGAFTSLTDLATRVNLQKVGKKTIELLTQAGAFDCFRYQREDLFATISNIVKYSNNHHSTTHAGQKLLFSFEEEDDSNEIADWEKKLSSKKRNNLNLEWVLKEKKILGVFLSKHPLEFFLKDQKKFSDTSIKKIPSYLGKKISVLAFLESCKTRMTKSGRKMAYLQLQDQSGIIEGAIFESDLPDKLPNDNTVVVVSGTITESFDKTSVNFRINHVLELEEKRRHSVTQATVKISLGSAIETENQSTSETLISKVNTLITENPGKTQLKLLLVYLQGSVNVKMQPQTLDLNDTVYHQFEEMKQIGAEICY